MADFLKVLKRQRKPVLVLLAAEFDAQIEQEDRVKDIIDKITGASDFDTETGELFLERILEELKEREAEAERVEAQKRDREDRVRREQQEFELERLRLSNAAETNSLESTVTIPVENTHRVNLKDLVPRFDPKSLDVNLFFELFERQARKEKVGEDRWVSQLIPLLPNDTAVLIAKEPVELGDKYDHVKGLLLQRFALSPVALKEKFENHVRKPGSSWSEFLFELRSYFEHWLEGVKVSDFEGLKELMIIEQVKKRVPMDVVEHYVDTWDEIKSAKTLVEKLDHYESVRKAHGIKREVKSGERRPVDKHKSGGEQKPFERRGSDRVVPKSDSEGEDKGETSREKQGFRNEERDKVFDKRREIVCFQCRQVGHIRPDCPTLKRNVVGVNHISQGLVIDKGFEPHLSVLKVNGIKRKVLKDTGSMIDICARSWVNPKDFLGEVVWVRQPLDFETKCLPLARIILEGKFGRVATKVAVKEDKLDRGVYLMGNETQNLIRNLETQVKVANMVEARSRAKRDLSPEKFVEKRSEKVEKEPSSVSRTLVDDPVGKKILTSLIDERKSGVLSIDGNEFKLEQEHCDSLKSLWSKAKEKPKGEFQVSSGKLVRYRISKEGKEATQIVIPVKFKEEILSFCHKETDGHLGIAKTKDRVLRSYYWPNCYREIKDFVKSCKVCDRNVKGKDNKKYPRKSGKRISKVIPKVDIYAENALPDRSKCHKFGFESEKSLKKINGNADELSRKCKD